MEQDIIENIKKEIKINLSTIKLRKDKIVTNEHLHGEYMELEGKEKAFREILSMINE